MTVEARLNAVAPQFFKDILVGGPTLQTLVIAMEAGAHTVVLFPHDHVMAGASQRDGAGEARRAGANDTNGGYAAMRRAILSPSHDRLALSLAAFCALLYLLWAGIFMFAVMPAAQA